MEGYGKYIFENIESYFEHYLESITNNKDIGFFKKFYILSNFDKAKSNGKINNFIGIYYIGHFIYNLPHGKGTIYYKNGKILYEGDFVKGKMEGNGKFFKLNDTCYDGNWKENLPHGKGITYDKNGKIIYDGDVIWRK